MKKHYRYYRFFGGFLDTQENWLNEMARKGFRLVQTGRISYDFEQCEPGEYQYAIEFVAHKSPDSVKEYHAFLEELGYKVFYKNMNLNVSFAKLRWRPFGERMGQISTNPGSYNKEIFIIEKKNDGKAFELRTTNHDKVEYYRPLRNTWLTIAVILFTISVWSYISKSFISKEVVVFALVGIVCIIPAIQYQTWISHFSACASIEE